jgi:hypothetical protein
VNLTLSAPETGRSGSTIDLQARLTVTAEVDDLSTPAAVDILDRGRIVGAYRGSIGGTGLGARPGPAGPVPIEPLLLSGCPRGAVDGAHPDATRQPLPAGDYLLVATIDTGGYGRASGLITSAPVPLRVTN